MLTVKRAIISVSDKNGIVDFAKELAALGVEIISTGGTYKLLKENGIGNYSIFLDEETNILFAYQEVSGEGTSQDLGTTEINRKWWDFMADIMEVNPDNSPVTIPLRQMFHLD